MENTSASALEAAFNRHSDHCLDGCVTRIGEYPVACGGYADIWKGQLATRGVAVKVMRPWSSSGKQVRQEKLFRRLWREYLAWSSLSHPNVIELLGFSYEFCPEWFIFPSLISPWMSNGTVDSYIENRRFVDRLQLLLGIAEGLSYLHSREPVIVHGDLRAGNVLVSDSGVPCLSDFGLSRVLSETKQTATSSNPAGSLRWMSPELFRDDGGVNVHSDIWAYGMTVLEVLTGNRPYSTLKNDAYVISQINDGAIPTRPEVSRVVDQFPDNVWSICCQCWCFNPMQRPSMQDIMSELSGEAFSCISRHSRIPSPNQGSHTPPIEVIDFLVKQDPSNDVGQDLSVGTNMAQPVRKQVLTTSSKPSGSTQPIRRSSSPQKPHGNVTRVDRNVGLAALVGTPQLEYSVGALIECYESLENIKTCKSLCKQLHARCVELLQDLQRIVNNTSGTNCADVVGETEITIDNVSRTFHTWSTWGIVKSIFRKTEIIDGLKKLNGDLSRRAHILNMISRMEETRAMDPGIKFNIEKSYRFGRLPEMTNASESKEESVLGPHVEEESGVFEGTTSHFFSIPQIATPSWSQAAGPYYSDQDVLHGPTAAGPRHPDQDVPHGPTVSLPIHTRRSSELGSFGRRDSGRPDVLEVYPGHGTESASVHDYRPISFSNTPLITRPTAGMVRRTQYLSSEFPLRWGLDYAPSYADAAGDYWSRDVFPKDGERCLDGLVTGFSSPLAFGRYADVRQGQLEDQTVAIKTIRPFPRPGTRINERRILERLWRKYRALSSVTHPNVLLCLGFTYELSPESFVFPSLVFRWMSNGTLSSYLEDHPDTDVYQLASGVLGIAKGLSYLHNQKPPIVHGDVRTGNILVSDSGVPCLSGLHLSEIFKREEVCTSADIVQPLRWMSPELLRYDTGPDLSSDVWAYGMTILEIASRTPPYQELTAPAAVLLQIRGGNSPSRPSSAILNDDLWAICVQCWIIDTAQRPLMRDVLSKLDHTTWPEGRSFEESDTTGVFDIKAEGS